VNLKEHEQDVRQYMRRGVVECCENGMIYSRPMTVSEWTRLKKYADELAAS